MILVADDALAFELGLDAAVFLKRAEYWLSKCGREVKGETKPYFYSSLKNLSDQFQCWSMSKLRNVIYSLESCGLLLSKRVNAKKWNQTKWYSVNYEKLQELLIKAKESRANFEVLFESAEQKQANNTNSLSLANKALSRHACVTVPEGEGTSNQGNRKSKQDITQKLIQIWESEIPLRKKQDKLAQENHYFLLRIFERYFGSDIGRWKRFTRHVTKSSFLMGKSSDFYINLNWIIKNNNLKKILSGKYHNVSIDVEDDRGEIMLSMDNPYAEIAKNTEGDPLYWREIKTRMLKRWGTTTYISWFRKLKYKSFKDGILTIHVHSGFIRDYVDARYSKGVFDIANEFLKGFKRVQFICPNEVTKAQQVHRYMVRQGMKDKERGVLNDWN